MKTLIVLILLAINSFSQSKAILAQSKNANISVRIKEHYGSYKVYENILLVVYDSKYYYLGRIKDTPLIIPQSRWAIDSVWIEK